MSRPWTAREDALVRRLPAAEVARRTGRTVKAAWDRRFALGCSTRNRRWTAAEDALVRALRPAEAARRTGRALKAVYNRRSALGLATGKTRRRKQKSGSRRAR